MGLWIVILGFLLACVSGYGLFRAPRRVAHWVGAGVSLLFVLVGILLYAYGIHALWSMFYWFALVVAPVSLLCLVGLLLVTGVFQQREKRGKSPDFFLIAGVLMGLVLVSVVILLFAPLGTVWSGLVYSLVFFVCYLAIMFLLFLLSFAYFSTLPKDAAHFVIDGIGEMQGEEGMRKMISRLQKALKRFQQGETQWILVEMETKPTSPSDTQAMKAYLVAQGVLEEDIVLEEQTDTVLALLCYISDQPNWKDERWMVLTDRCDVWTVALAMDQLQLQGDVVGAEEIRPDRIQRLAQECARFFFRARSWILICGIAWFVFFVASLMPIWG